jgi:hypothetical protein
MGRLRNIKHERFSHAVAALVPLGTAYREAGYAGDEKWHPYNGSRLANQSVIKARIEELRQEFERTCADGAVVHANYVRSQLVPLIEVDGAELFEQDPGDPTKRRLRDIGSMPKHLTKAIARIKLDGEGRPAEVVLHSKIEAAGALLRSLPGGGRLAIDDASQLEDKSDPEVVAGLLAQMLTLIARYITRDLLEALEAEIAEAIVQLKEGKMSVLGLYAPPADHEEQPAHDKRGR